VCRALEKIEFNLLRSRKEQVKGVRRPKSMRARRLDSAISTAGVCLPHFQMLHTSQTLSTETQHFLTLQQRNSIRRLLPFLQKFSSKSYSLTDDSERSSIKRSVEKLIGWDGLT
jgi:hypothetical protein